MSKKEESVKLNADELVVIQELNQKFMQTKVVKINPKNPQII